MSNSHVEQNRGNGVVGGQFGYARDAADGDTAAARASDLDDDTGAIEHPRFGLLEETERGRYKVDSSVVKRTERSNRRMTRGVTTTSYSIGGDPHRGAEVASTVALYRETHPAPTAEELGAMADSREKVTVLRAGESVLGASGVEIMEGTLFSASNGRIGILRKGSRKHGEVLTDPLDVVKGYGGQDTLYAKYRDVAETAPRLEPVSFDNVPVAEDDTEPPSEIAAAYVFTHPGFDSDRSGRAPGSVFFATDVMVDDEGNPEILNGYTWFPPESGLISEHGSMYPSDLERMNAGRCADYQSGSLGFSDCINMRDADRDTVYSTVNGN